MAQDQSDVIIWRNISIGAPDAETDRDLMLECFVDTGALDFLRDPESPQSIVVGRTGHGKSALLLRLAQMEEHAFPLNLFEVAFKYVENSTVLRFFEDAGVNLGLLYKLLWRHVLVTELLKVRYDLNDQPSWQRWFDQIHVRVRPESPKGKALAYLRTWGDRFWEESEVRLKEVTANVERQLQSSLEGSLLAAKMKAGGVQTLSEQERSEVQARGSDVVNKIQVRELSQLVDLLDEQVFADEKKPYFILIDGLDEEWVGSRSRIRLIRALLEEIRSLRKIRRVKVVCSMRSDLLEQVFNETRDGGFQEEKYEAYYCHLAWTPTDLESMVDKRLNEVFRRKYTGRAVGFKEIFPSTRQTTPMQYMLERTFHRPRDVIAFVNECLHVGSDRPRISWQGIYQAETAYSKKRLRSLFDEWHSLIPSLRFVVEVIRGMPESFTRSQIRKEAFEELSISLHSGSVDDYLSRTFRAAYEDKGSNYSESDLICCALQQLFHVGMIGVKTGEQSPFVWASRQQATMSRGEIKRSTHIKIHKMFWKALEVRTESAIRFKGADGYRE